MSWIAHGNRELGKERMERYMQTRARVDFELSTLPLALGAVWKAEYSDEALAALQTDITDLLEATQAHHDLIVELINHWRAQRQEGEG